MLSYYLDKAKRIINHRHFQYGLPFFTLLIGASFALPYMTHHRYEFRRNNKSLSEAEIEGLKKQGIIKKDPLSLEEIHTEYIEANKESIENYKNVRIARPWEEADPEAEARRKANKKLPSITDVRRLEVGLKPSS